MGWDGSGNITRTDGILSGSNLWVANRDGGIKINAARHDYEMNDFVTTIMNTLARDGQNSPSADINWGGHQITNLGSGTARTSAINVGQVQDGSPLWGGTAGGTANALTISLSPAITTLVTGLVVLFKVNSDSTTANPTLNVNGTGAIGLVRGDGTTGLSAKELRSGTILKAIYDGSKFRVVPFGAKLESFTPTLGAAGSMTWTATSVDYAKFVVLTGFGLVACNVRASGTVGGTLSNYLTHTLPIDCVSNLINFGHGIIAQAANYGTACQIVDVSTLGISKYDSSNLVAGAGTILSKTLYPI